MKKLESINSEKFQAIAKEEMNKCLGGLESHTSQSVSEGGVAVDVSVSIRVPVGTTAFGSEGQIGDILTAGGAGVGYDEADAISYGYNVKY